MTLNITSSVWDRRWEALSAELDDMQTSYEKASFPRQQTLLTLVNNLRCFGKALFVLYWNQFNLSDGDKPIPGLEPIVDYPEAYVFNMFLDRVAQDITVIRTAAAQRLETSNAKSDMAVLERQALLKRSDRLAYKALEPALDKWCPGATVLTYLGNIPRARVIPYAEVALVGIPFTARGVKQDYLATAHEVGHYLYWNAQYSADAEIHRAKHPYNVPPDLPKWCVEWREELFADMYGAWVAGAPAALTIQDILLDNLPTDFCKNDNEHPTSYIRPHIYNKVLNDKGLTIDQAWVAHLRERWQMKQQDWELTGIGVAEFVTGNNKKSSFAEVINRPDDITRGIVRSQEAKPVDKLMGRMLDLLKDITPTTWANASPTSTNEPDTIADDNTLLQGFDVENGLLINVKVTEVTPSLASYDDFSVHPLVKRLIDRAKAGNSIKTKWEELVFPFAWVSRGPDEQPNPPKP